MRSKDGRRTTGEQHANDRAGGKRANDTDGDAGGGLMDGVAGALLGLVGIGAVSGVAGAARGATKRLLVVGDGTGKHTYEVEMKSGGTISKAAHAGGNDSIRSSYRDATADGEVWHYNADTYTYTGELRSVTCDGDLSVHFLDGGFGTVSWLSARGRSAGKHQYRMDTAGGDIDPVPSATGGNDSDDRGPASERNDTPDTVSGQVTDRNYDAFVYGSNDAIKHIGVTDGHLEFSR
jgi:hypothetical protein